MIERKSGKKWKAYTSVAGRFSSRFLSGDTAKVSSKFKLAKSGWYRVRARLVDAAHPRGVFSAWKTVRVR